MARIWRSNSAKTPLINAPREETGPSPHAITVTGDGRIGGSSGADTLTGGSGPDILIGHGGADTLTGNDGDDVLMGERTAVRNASLAGVQDFAIIYNGNAGANYTQAGLKSSDHDLVIIYPASSINFGNHTETLWTATAIADIQTTKLVIAYLDITKINDYEAFVWQPAWTSNGLATGTNTGAAPNWLGALDSGDPNNTTRLVNLDVANWADGLKPFLFARIDALVARGYNGLFLDDLRFFVDGNPAATAVHAREIRDLVIDLAEYARAAVLASPGGSPAAAANFAIIVNGAPFMIDDTDADGTPFDAAAAAVYYASIDGILAETYFHRPGLGEYTVAINTTIRNFGAQGIALFSADQNVSAGQVAAVEAAADLAGFIPFTIPPGSNYGTDSPRFNSTMGDDSPGNDLLSGGGGADVLIGGGGNDVLDGGTGIDRMHGSAGNDIFYVDNGADAVLERAGEGNDRIAASVSFALAAGAEIETLEAITLSATNAMNLTGNEFANTITGNNGVNILTGGGGNDALAGAGGDDYLVGGGGNDAMDGGAGNDTYYVEEAGDTAADGAGQGTDRVAASASYALASGSEIETLEAITLGATNAMNLTGNAFGQTIVGNDGANILTGGGGNDTMVGAGGNDVLIGNSSASSMSGGAGNDTYYVSDTSDMVFEAAGQGADRIAAAVSYTLPANSEVEILEAVNSGATTALNFAGSGFGNALVGNAGANVLDGKGGNDALVGLGGADTFQFTTAPGAGNVDTIEDFAHGTDKIALDDAVFTALAPGALAAGAFVVGAAAADADDRIVYNSATGQLYYDADGSGAGIAVQFVLLGTGLPLSASDFIVI